MKAEQIDTPPCSKGAYERYVKRQTAKGRRREAKIYIKEITLGRQPKELNPKQYSGWTM